ncbi:MAG TPA: hypothetical protein VI685_11025 [Candidatus Angelobacter sp.]
MADNSENIIRSDEASIAATVRPNDEREEPAGGILAALEPNQLTATKQHFPRRQLKGPEAFLVWSLRIYLLFMLVVVIYQIWTGK